MPLRSLNAGLGFFTYAEKFRKMSSPAPMDSLYLQHNFGYLPLGQRRVSATMKGIFTAFSRKKKRIDRKHPMVYSLRWG